MPTLSRSNSCVDIDFTLRRQFKKTSFRPNQREIIIAALERHDVFVQAATSFGKSLCFQLPAVIDQGFTIVICPLLSLMMNQVEALKQAGVKARALNGNTQRAERDEIYKDITSGHPFTKLLYVTPELCSTDTFRERLQKAHLQKQLARVVVDEAHCISEWGHDFRQDFKRLSWLRETFEDVPIMCLTATANAHVRQDVLNTLRLFPTPPIKVEGDANRTAGGERCLKTFTTTAFRPNLHIEIRFTSDDARSNRLEDFVSWLKTVHARRGTAERRASLEARGDRVDNVPGIIYTMYRKECENLAEDLRRVGFGARHFHAGLSKEAKQGLLARWIKDEPGYDIIVATTAFGMGIDKDNVRFVVHWQLPKSFEGYYQELGRAGRDGKASYCFLYYSREDRDRIARKDSGGKDGENKTARLESWRRLIEYCEDTRSCRHAALCRYFGEPEEPACDFACDWHRDPQGLKDRFRMGLADEEYVSTQREEGKYDNYDYDEEYVSTQMGENRYDEYDW